MLENLYWLLPKLSHSEWFVHGLIFAVNILSYIFAKPIISFLDQQEYSENRIRLLRYVNMAVLILHALDLLLYRLSDVYQHYFIKLGYSLMVIYAGVFLISLSSYLSRKRFGIERSIDDKIIFLNSYSSRLVDIISMVIIAFTTLYLLIAIWEINSFLETTGLIGIIAGFLAITGGVWAPDVIAGLIILNSKMLEDGDVIVFKDSTDYFIIHKVTVFYVTLYNVKKNHRTIIRNSQFTHDRIDNLSRLASSDGLRMSIDYNIGYPQTENYIDYKNSIDNMFLKAFENSKNNESILINPGKPFHWALTETGDYALKYTLWFYLDRIPNTKVTSRIRRYLTSTPFKVNEQVFIASLEKGVNLSTPSLYQLSESSLTIANHQTTTQSNTEN